MKRDEYKINEDGVLEIKRDGLRIELPLAEMFEGLSDEEREWCAERLTWGEIYKEARRRLTGDSRMLGDDEQARMEFLCAVEDQLISGYKWSLLRDLNQLAKDIATHEHIYWKLYHEPNEELRLMFWKWMQSHKIESNYTAQLPTIESFQKTVDEHFRKLAESKKQVSDAKG